MCAVTQRDVRDFMCDHARQLSFALRSGNRRAICIDLPARERKGTDLRSVDKLERVRITLAWRLLREPMAEAIEIFKSASIADELQLLLRLEGGLLADLDVLLR